MEHNETADNETEKVEFSGLILGFCSAALSYMGLAPNGTMHTDVKNLKLAQQNIDIIELLKEKTAGNLTEEEEKLTAQVLIDLKMKYVESAKES